MAGQIPLDTQQREDELLETRLMILAEAMVNFEGIAW